MDDAAFRSAMRRVVERSGRSLRSLSIAMGRDQGYLAALLDPRRPSRARPTPDDLVALSDATAIPLIELFEALWGIPVERFAGEVHDAARPVDAMPLPYGLSPNDRRMVREFAAFLAARHDAETNQ